MQHVKCSMLSNQMKETNKMFFDIANIQSSIIKKPLTHSWPVTYLAHHEESFREANDRVIRKLLKFFLLFNLNNKFYFI